MEHRTRMGSFFDRIIGTVLLLLGFTIFFATKLHHLLFGAAMALFVTGMLLYAYILWRRRTDGIHSDQARAQWHLHNLMLFPLPKALQMAGEMVAAKNGWVVQEMRDDTLVCLHNDQTISIVLLQATKETHTTSNDILRCYHRATSSALVILSTAAFTVDASIFARQLKSPRIALLGPQELLALFQGKPAPEDAPLYDQKKRSRATWAELRSIMTHPDRGRRYLIYGSLLLLAYLVLHSFAFLLPGLVCIFLAIISKHQNRLQKSLFEQDKQ